MVNQPAPATPGYGTWGLVWRHALAIIIGGLGFVVAAGESSIGQPVAIIIDVCLGIAAALTIRLRHRHPLWLMLALALISLVSVTSAGYMVWSYVHLCTRRRRREIVVAAFVITVVQFVGYLLGLPWNSQNAVVLEQGGNPVAPGSPAFLMSWVVSTVGVTALLTAWGLYLGARRDLVASLRERADTAEREQELQVRAGQAAERNRIAREMHDVLAHRLSLVSMHAGALAFRTDLDAEQTREVARTIQENAHQSLTELRSVLGSLRDEDAGTGPAKPQPTLVDVHTLIDDVRAAGAKVDFTHRVTGELPDRVGRHGYRIIQEALTNARKHAPHTRVTLSVSGNPEDGLTILARNPSGRGGPVPGSGAGLLGLAERAQMLGGTIEHGFDDEGWFELKVWLPW